MQGYRPDDLDAHGVLRLPAEGHYEVRRYRAPAALAGHVDWLWSVEWDRGGRPPHEQRTVPTPVTHLTVEDGAAWVHGAYRGRFAFTLADAGRVVGARIKVGALRAWIDRPVAALADGRHPAELVHGLDAAALAAAVDAAPDTAAGARILADALEPVVADLPPDPDAALAARAVACLAEDRSIVRTAQLADRLHVSVRTLQRVFASHVGLGPAGVIRRLRLQEAVRPALGGAPVDWARVAADLGYCDQAHLIREFTAVVGVPPARYARGRADSPQSG